MDSRTIVFILSLLLSLPLSTLYILQIIIIVSRRSIFYSPFYRIFVFGGFVDLAFYWLTVFLYVLPNLPILSDWTSQFTHEPDNLRWREEYSSILSMLNSLMYFLPAIQDGVNVLIAFNRFCAIVLPFAYSKIFTPLTTNFFLLLVISSGFIPSFLTIGARGGVLVMGAPKGTDEMYMLHSHADINFPNINRSLVVSLHLLITNSISFILYCITTIQLRRSNFRDKSEIRLLILGLAILIFNIPSIAYQFFFVFYDGEMFWKYFQILPFFNLVKTLNPPVIMIITNNMMRKNLKSLFGFEEGVISVETTANISLQTRKAENGSN